MNYLQCCVATITDITESGLINGDRFYTGFSQLRFGTQILFQKSAL